MPGIMMSPSPSIDTPLSLDTFINRSLIGISINVATFSIVS